MTHILFADLLKPKINIRKGTSGTYWGELEALVDRYNACPTNWVTTYSTKKIRQERQLDKFEPVITYYAFTALNLVTNGFADSQKLMPLIKKAFPSGNTADMVIDLLRASGWQKLYFEAQLTPVESIKKRVKGNVGLNPIAYHREVGQKKSRVRFESATKFDVFVGQHSSLTKGKGRCGLGIEAKFTSDIDDHTTYSPHRNQIVRCVEVGNARFSEFVFLLVIPRAFWEQRSRLYVYKMQEYLSQEGPRALCQDALIDPGEETARKWQARMGWIAWEDIVDVLFPGGQPSFDHPDAADLQEFLRSRLLLK